MALATAGRMAFATDRTETQDLTVSIAGRSYRVGEKDEKRVVVTSAAMARDPSMFSSSLLPERWVEPSLDSLPSSSDSLRSDAMRFQKKYEERGFAQYTRSLPKSPQHNKFMSRRDPPEQRQANVQEEAEFGADGAELKKGPKFSVRTIVRWFEEMDKDRDGYVSRTELIKMLHFKGELREHLCSHVKGGEAEDPDPSKGALEIEIRRILRVMRTLDKDKSGELSWDEFIGFFQEIGTIIEYGNNQALNDKTYQPNAMKLVDTTSDVMQQITAGHVNLSELQIHNAIVAGDHGVPTVFEDLTPEEVCKSVAMKRAREAAEEH